MKQISLHFFGKTTRPLLFAFIILIIITLTISTILEKRYGTPFIHQHIYDSWGFALLWFLAAISSIIHLYNYQIYKKSNELIFYLAFILILSGAFCTWQFSENGSIQLIDGNPSHQFISKGTTHTLPFSLTLTDFETINYAGTNAPLDYISHINISDQKQTISAIISMNDIITFRHYRFYQFGYNEKGDSVTLAVTHNPWGIALTYSGYALLILAIIVSFFNKKSQFRQLLNHPLIKKTALLIIFSGMLIVSNAANPQKEKIPKVLPPEIAEQFCDLYILYNQRICPIQTLAFDFTVKLYGKPNYKGLTPEQFFTGWLFFYDSWKDEPCLKIKKAEVRKALDTEEKFSSYTNLTDTNNAYKLADILNDIHRGKEVAQKSDFMAIDEKYNLIKSLYTGNYIQIFPHLQNEQLQWLSPTSPLPSDLDSQEILFIRKSLYYLQLQIIAGNFEEVEMLLSKIGIYQKQEGNRFLPNRYKYQAEKLYNQLLRSKVILYLCFFLGILSIITIGNHHRITFQSFNNKGYPVFAFIILLYITFLIVLRGYISGHIPLANGYETMQFMALGGLFLSLIIRNRIRIALPFGFILAGLSMMVGAMGLFNPQITPLVPILRSPLMSIHVLFIMSAYLLLAFMLFNSLAAFITNFKSKDYNQLEHFKILNKLLLIPAVSLLATGIIIGSVWANISWGRYWAWDPKEVWALITLLIYSLPLLHSKAFESSKKFHIFCIIGFLSVLITYFGVNYIFGGIHAYS